MRPEIRIAENHEGERIKALLSAQGSFDQTIPFDNISPHWLVALVDNRIVGCVQVLHGRPFGHLEMIGIDQTLSDIARGTVWRELMLSGIALLAYNGSTHFRGFVGFHLKGYKRALRKRGGIVTDSGNMILKRIV